MRSNATNDSRRGIGTSSVGTNRASLSFNNRSPFNDFSRAEKPTCLDDRDTNSPLDKDRDTILRVLKSDPQDLANSRRTKLINYLVLVLISFLSLYCLSTVRKKSAREVLIALLIDAFSHTVETKALSLIAKKVVFRRRRHVELYPSLHVLRVVLLDVFTAIANAVGASFVVALITQVSRGELQK